MLSPDGFFVDTPMVQEHILKHGGNERLYTIMLQLAELTHLAYDPEEAFSRQRAPGCQGPPCRSALGI